MEFYCSKCEKTYPVAGLDYKCECGGLFKLKKDENEKVEVKVSLGETMTPIIVREINGIKIHIKLDYMMPTGSFKDRGACILINKLKELGITKVIEDSSGNAGASIAAYCAAAGIECNIYIPKNTSDGKVKQIEAYGAKVLKVEGSRDETARETYKAAQKVYYASHVYNPLFFEGVKSLVYEIKDQIGIPDYLIVPVGNGTMLLGAYYGFKEMGKIPKIIAVQSENCSPIYNKFYNINNIVINKTIAEGIAVGVPKRIDEIIEAIKYSKGDIITVNESEMIDAWQILCHMGIYAEMTSSSVIAGTLKYFKDIYNGNTTIVAPITGIGLKK